ncbi:MAG: pitrilysin family protein [Polyangiaceae bacterium]
MTHDRADVAYTVGTLANGLRVVVAPSPSLHRAHVALHARVGSRFETSERNGISHFLEHMIYRGTKDLPSAHEVNYAFERHGGYLYAATHVDFGVFSLTLPPENLGVATQLFGDVLRGPEFHDIDIEKGIVCEEILEDLDDEGRQIDADNLSRSLVYPHHALGYTITGDEARVRSFDVPALREHHARHYTAKNSVLAFGGAVDPDTAMALAERAFGRLPSGEVTKAVAPVHTQKKPRILVVDNTSSQTELRLSFRALPASAPERHALDLMMRIVDDGMSTRLYHRVCDEKGLCYDVSAGYDGYEDDGIVDFAAGVQHARTSVVAREILELMTELATIGPTEEELAKAKRRQLWDMGAMRDSSEEFASYYAHGLLFGRLEPLEERKEALARVTTREVRDVAALLARPERLNVVAVGLLEDGEDRRLADVAKGWKGAATTG